MTLLYVSNTSPSVSDGDFDKLKQSLARFLQIAAPGWTALTGDPCVAELLFQVRDAVPADPAGAGAYHFEDPATGRKTAPILTTRASSLLVGPESLSCYLSHEAYEALRDPSCNRWVDLPDGKTQQADERADPVQGVTWRTPEKADVTDFVFSETYFDPEGRGPFDYCQALKASFSLAPGGYRILRDRASGAVSFDWGAEVKEVTKAAKMAFSRAALRF